MKIYVNRVSTFNEFQVVQIDNCEHEKHETINCCDQCLNIAKQKAIEKDEWYALKDSTDAMYNMMSE